MEPIETDLLIVGGGINGAGIARDAAGRGLRVMLVEQGDLAGHTSSASTKLIHGGLRYLETGDLRLVRESLIERERLWRMAPHIIWPLSFVLPQTHSPRPAWLVRLGLFLYDHLGGRKRLPVTETIRLDRSPLGAGLSDRGGRAFVYADCWVDDSRLVVLNAMAARELGAAIMTRTCFLGATRAADAWHATLATQKGKRTVHARALVNAAGPWVSDILSRASTASDRRMRLVKGSHIVVPRLTAGTHAFTLQQPDRRIVFVLPLERDFSLIGTTDQPWNGPPGKAAISEGETLYLLTAANLYFERQMTPADVRWSYAGIRPLYDDHHGSAATVTRDYVLDLDAGAGSAPILSVFGGKITSYRRLAEQALDRLAVYLPTTRGAWTSDQPLPGGDMPDGDFARFEGLLAAAYPGFRPALIHRLARAYGTHASAILGTAKDESALGEQFGAGLSAAELDYLVDQEWARTAEDVLFRRSKLGLHLPPDPATRVQRYLDTRPLNTGTDHGA